ncbi:MAG: ATP-binding protein [Longimicrobiales bacterium]|nr:ATP-binding protein [Longimicrobiales bacterium]
MRLSVRNALLVAFAVVAALVLMMTTVAGHFTVREDLVERSRAELRRELSLIAPELERMERAAADSVARAVTARIGHRVTVIDTSGVVLGDSDVSPDRLPDVENHRNRPEIAEAIRSGPGSVEFAERRSATVDRRLLYAARLSEMGGAPVVLRLAASLDDLDGALERFRRIQLGVGLLALALALVAGQLLGIRFGDPLSGLAGTVRSVAEGDLRVRAPRDSRIRELDELAGAFNRMTEELQAQMSELGRQRDRMQALIDSMAEGVLALTEDARILRTNEAARELLDLPEPHLYAPVGSLIRNPELRELLESAVIRSFQSREVGLGDRHLIVQSRVLAEGGAVVTLLDVTELRRLEQVRRDFVANASHELKTPLTSMRGFAETLLEDDPGPEMRRRFLEAIHDNTIRLQRLIDDLLDLSRLESGGWVAKPESLRVGSIVEEVWKDMEDRAEKKELDFEVEGDAVVRADPRGLSEVLRNLLENSIQYTSEGGRVWVEIRDRGSEVEVRVCDTGMGISLAALPRVFERFYRADPARSREEGGTGLGLAIVKHLVDAMEGRVAAQSRLGRGTTFTVTLPAG